LIWLISSISYIIVYNRDKNRNRALIYYDQSNYAEISEIKYQGVIWKIIVSPDWTGKILELSNYSSEDIDINFSPRCPDCGTKLEEREGLICGYIWKCVKCGYKTRNKDSSYIERTRVKKIAESEWEQIKHNNNNNQHEEY